MPTAERRMRRGPMREGIFGEVMYGMVCGVCLGVWCYVVRGIL